MEDYLINLDEYVRLSKRYNDNGFEFGSIHIKQRRLNHMIWLRTMLMKNIKDPFTMVEVDNIIKMEDLTNEQKIQLCKTYFE